MHIHLNAVWHNINKWVGRMSKSKWIILILLSSALLYAENPREYISKRTHNPPTIDGVLSDECWNTITPTGGFKMHKPHDDRPATFDTQFSILYDNNNLYIAVRAFDPEPEKIYRKISRRDNVNSEFVGICIDSYHDKNTAYCFFVNASGVMGDIFISKDGENNDESWNAIWWAKTQIDDKGWTAEYRIPLSQLRFTDKAEQIWGLDLMRDVRRLDEESFWAPHKRNDQGFIHQFGTLRGLHNIKARKVADIYPYVVGSHTSYEAEAGNPYMDGSDQSFNVGLDGKIGLTNNFTMDFTINPDFGQVEADPATVNLSAFETFFGERRPFFIEGSSITSFSLDVNGSQEQLFHSRRIGRRPQYWPDLNDNEYADMPSSTNILAAAKITGRTQKGLSIGIVEALTRKEVANINTSLGDSTNTVEPLTNYSVAALRQDLNNGNTQIGGIITATHRKLDEEHLDYLRKQAYTGGLDLRHYFKDHIWQIDARAYGSYVQGSEEAISITQQSSSHLYQRPDAPWITYDSTRTSLAGHGASMRIGKFAGQYRAAIKVGWKSPGLELNDVGFIGGTDEIRQNIWFQYRQNKPHGIFNWYSTNFTQWNNFNFGGIHQNSGMNLQWNSRFKNRLGFDLGIEINSDFTSSTKLRGGPRLRLPGSVYLWTFIGSDYTKEVEYWFFTIIGKQKDKLGYMNQIENEISWKVSPFLNLSLYADWYKEQEPMQYVTSVEHDNETKYILANLTSQSTSLQLAVNWNISPNISLEYRARPFFMSGKYDQFKRVTDSDNKVYENRFDEFVDNITLVDGEYFCDENQDLVNDYSFDDPNFVYTSFQSNLVFRWEYQPGSTLFLVWSQNNQFVSDANALNIPMNVHDLYKEIPQNVILLKASYRLGR